MKPLIIVESFAKTKTISKYLENKYTVICSYGHINNLPTHDLGIDTEQWIGNYIITNKKAIDNIRKHVREANIIYIAADPDTEGEAIAYHIYNNIKDLLKNKQHYRISFNEITKVALQNALSNPRAIDMNIVCAQETRRFVDRLVGYKMSPLLWSKFNNNTLSAGRVQSIAMLICKQQLDKIMQHKADVYWKIIGIFVSKRKKFEFALYQNSEEVKASWKQAEKIIDELKFDNNLEISFAESKSTQRPPPPYITTTLQQDAYNKHRFTPKKTMELAQQLYENGLITYMRTDSNNISDQFKNTIIKYIDDKYPGHSQFRHHQNKVSNAQEAHEAIRITNIGITSPSDMSGDCNKLYKMIWLRTITSQMIAAEYTDLVVSVKIPDSDYVFIHKKSLLTTLGFMVALEKELDDVKEYIKSIKSIKVSEFHANASIDSVPSLYNEVSLIKELERNGIGRPSTYSSIIDKLVSKKYVTIGSNPCNKMKCKNLIKTAQSIQQNDIELSTGNGKKDVLVPSVLGIDMITYLATTVPFLLDMAFTSNMETTMDEIANHKLSKKSVLDDFYKNHLLPIIQNNQTISPKVVKKETGIIHTKYGYCYYDATNNKYTNIESFLAWKNKSVEELTEKEKEFIKSLPKKIDKETTLHIGQYGLYLKQKNKNIRLDKTKWDSYIY